MTDVFRRQNRLYDPEAMNKKIFVVGCGSLGSYIAVGLAKLGLHEFVLYDNDTVEAHNIPNQAFTMADNDNLKVHALTDLIFANSVHTVNGDIPVDVAGSSCHWTPHIFIPSDAVVINAADSIIVREEVAKATPDGNLIIDVRSGNNSFNIFFCEKGKKDEWDFYNQFFFKPDAAATTNCNLQSIVYSSMLIASLAIKGYVDYANGVKYPVAIEGDLTDFSICPEYLP